MPSPTRRTAGAAIFGLNDPRYPARSSRLIASDIVSRPIALPQRDDVRRDPEGPQENASYSKYTTAATQPASWQRRARGDASSLFEQHAAFRTGLTMRRDRGCQLSRGGATALSIVLRSSPSWPFGPIRLILRLPDPKLNRPSTHVRTDPRVDYPPTLTTGWKPCDLDDRLNTRCDLDDRVTWSSVGRSHGVKSVDRQGRMDPS